jgi:hypothetical protein
LTFACVSALITLSIGLGIFAQNFADLAGQHTTTFSDGDFRFDFFGLVINRVPLADGRVLRKNDSA